MSASQTSLWQGPLPPPAAVAEFNSVVENGAERIFAEWEAEANHRRNLEHRALTAEIVERVGSRLLAFVFVLTALAGSVFLGFYGHDVLAGTIGTTTIGLVLASFIYNNTKK